MQYQITFRVCCHKSICYFFLFSFWFVIIIIIIFAIIIILFELYVYPFLLGNQQLVYTFIAKKILEPNELIIERSMWTCQEFASSLLLALDCCACNSYGIVHLVSSFLLKVDKYLPDEFALKIFRKTISYRLIRSQKIYYNPCI